MDYFRARLNTADSRHSGFGRGIDAAMATRPESALRVSLFGLFSRPLSGISAAADSEQCMRSCSLDGSLASGLVGQERLRADAYAHKTSRRVALSLACWSIVTVFAKLASFDQSTVINALARDQVGLAIEERF